MFICKVPRFPEGQTRTYLYGNYFGSFRREKLGRRRARGPAISHNAGTRGRNSLKSHKNPNNLMIQTTQEDMALGAHVFMFTLLFRAHRRRPHMRKF